MIVNGRFAILFAVVLSTCLLHTSLCMRLRREVTSGEGQPEEQDNSGSTKVDENGTEPDDKSTEPDYKSSEPDDKSTAPDEENTTPDEENTEPDEENTTPDEENTEPDEENTLDAESTDPGAEGTNPDTDNQTPTEKGDQTSKESLHEHDHDDEYSLEDGGDDEDGEPKEQSDDGSDQTPPDETEPVMENDVSALKVNESNSNDDDKQVGEDLDNSEVDFKNETLSTKADGASTVADELPGTNGSSIPEVTNTDETTTATSIFDEEIPFIGGFIFDVPVFFNFQQVELYFKNLENAMDTIFQRTLDEFARNPDGLKNATEQIVDIGGQKYDVRTIVMKKGDENRSVSIEAMSSVPTDKTRKRRNAWQL